MGQAAIVVRPGDPRLRHVQGHDGVRDGLITYHHGYSQRADALADLRGEGQ